jgi:hypothetical protein
MVYGYKYKLTQIISSKPASAHSFPHSVFFPNHLCGTRYTRKNRERKEKKKPEMIPKKGRGKPQR